MFTSSQIEEIKKKLQLDGVKDTSFPDASNLTGSEILALVQDGTNKKMTAKELAEYISRFIDYNGGTDIPDLTSFIANAYGYESEEAEAFVDYGSGAFRFRIGIPKGAKGDKGDKGDRGPSGYVAVSSFPATAYKQSDTKPEKPISGSWHPDLNKFVYPGEELLYPSDEGWGPSDELEGIVWQSNKVFHSDPSLDSEWSDPIRITGESGEPGADGVNLEFIFKLTETSLDVPTVPPQNQQADWVPHNYGWTDNPQGIDETMQCEWMCQRSKNLNSGVWGPWIGPAIWSKWGANGQDGSGVQYIFYKDSTGQGPNLNLHPTTPTDWLTNEEYQDKLYEYVPDGWEDEFKGVDEENQWCWVAIRKYRPYIDDNGTNRGEKWLPFSEPALWAKYGQDGYSGISYIVEYAVAEGTSTPPPFNKDNVDPGSAWSKAFPAYDRDSQSVWAIGTYVTYDNQFAEYSVFKTDENGEYVLDDDGNKITEKITGWQGPWIATGVIGDTGVVPNYITTVFALSSTRPEKPDSDDPKYPGQSINSSGEIVQWVDYPNAREENGLRWWSCDGLVNGVTEQIQEDEDGNLMWGEVLPCSGVDGEAKEGRYKVTMLLGWLGTPVIDNPSASIPTSTNAAGVTIQWSPINNPPEVPYGGKMWCTESYIKDGYLLQDWGTPWAISGEQGPQGETGPAGAIGPAGPQGLSGVPGVRIEARYTLGDETGPQEGVSDPTKFNYVEDIDDPTTGWLKLPPSPTTGKLYIWCTQARVASIRRGSTDTFDLIFEDNNKWCTPFRLNGLNGLGENGLGISDIKEFYSTNSAASGITSSNKNNYTWVENEAPQYTDTNKYLWNYEQVWYTDGSKYETDPILLGVYGKDGKGIKEIKEYYMIYNSPTLPNNKVPNTKDQISYYGWKSYSANIHTVNRDNPYLFNIECIDYTDNTYSISIPTIIGVYTVGEKGRAGQIVYPAGVYSNSVRYVATDTKAPYVYDADWEAYYVLNTTDPRGWLGTEQGNYSPGDHYDLNKNDQDNLVWLKMDSFDAIYANIGIFGNALVGSAVFNGDYVFSQQGTTTIDGTIPGSYENFNPQDPFGNNNSFYPNVCFNFKTGELWIGKNTKFNGDGSGYLGGTDMHHCVLSWNKEGITRMKHGNEIYMDGTISTLFLSSKDVYQNQIVHAPGDITIMSYSGQIVGGNDNVNLLKNSYVGTLIVLNKSENNIKVKTIHPVSGDTITVNIPSGQSAEYKMVTSNTGMIKYYYTNSSLALN